MLIMKVATYKIVHRVCELISVPSPSFAINPNCSLTSFIFKKENWTQPYLQLNAYDFIVFFPIGFLHDWDQAIYKFEVRSAFRLTL